MRTLSVFAVLVTCASLQAQKDKPKQIDPYKMEVGDSGEIMIFVNRYLIESVEDKRLIIHAERNDGGIYFAVRGITTDGFVDGKKWNPTGQWKVTGTEKWSGKTIYTVTRMPTKNEKK